LLVVGVLGITLFGFFRQASVKPPAAPITGDCINPVTDNRLRETLKQSPNDFATLMDWGSYNLTCEKNYPISVAAYQQAVRLSDDQATSTVQPTERINAHFQLGLAYLYNQNFNEAQAQFELILKEDPKYTSAMLALSAILSKDDPAKAQGYLEQILEIEPPTSNISIRAKAMLDDMKKHLK
jgi:tetratricopeptide (TPR) repeat protein